MDVSFARLRFTLRLEEPTSARFALFALKDIFPKVFRAVICTGQKNCSACTSHEMCPRCLAFSQRLANDPAAVKRHQKPSLPFVFHVPVLPEYCQVGDMVSCDLILIGRAVTHAAAYCKVLINLFADPCRPLGISLFLMRIDSVGCSQYLVPIYSEDVPVLKEQLAVGTLGDLLELHTFPPDEVEIQFLTPLRCLSAGRVLSSFSFSPFFRSLMRRVSSLAYYYCGIELPIDYSYLAEASNSIVCVDNSACWNRVSTGGSDGLLGKVSLHGSLSEFYPVLLMGELVNCGKDASYGRGQFLMASASTVG